MSGIAVAVEADFAVFRHLLQLIENDRLELNPRLPCLVQNYVRLKPLIKHCIYLLEVFMGFDSKLTIAAIYHG